jgi:hypothetical protein
MTERLHIVVSFNPALGFVSAASHQLPRSLVALSLTGLRRQAIIAFLRRWKKPDQPVAVHLTLDDAARAEVERRTTTGPTRPNTLGSLGR